MFGKPISGVVNQYAEVLKVYNSNPLNVDSVSITPNQHIFNANDTVLIYQAQLKDGISIDLFVVIFQFLLPGSNRHLYSIPSG